MRNCLPGAAIWQLSCVRTIGQQPRSVRLLREIAQAIGDRILEPRVEDIRLAGRQATTLALVTNELISNALKHGAGKIAIVFDTNDDYASLQVCDDGPGFPEDFDPLVAANTGLELIDNVVRWDLRGEIRYDNDSQGGARITGLFPLRTLK